MSLWLVRDPSGAEPRGTPPRSWLSL